LAAFDALLILESSAGLHYGPYIMGTVTEISAAIRQLKPDERWGLLHEFADELWSDWDRQIEDDLEAGKLDRLIADAEAEIAAGNVRLLNEVIRDA